jgi:hypothetical protein
MRFEDIKPLPEFNIRLDHDTVRYVTGLLCEKKDADFEYDGRYYNQMHSRELGCLECLKTHETIAFCRVCGACLYFNSKQIPDNNYPLFECTRCDATNFWD